MKPSKLLILYFIIPLALAAQGNRVSMDFPGVELGVFLEWYGNLSGKRIIYQEGRAGLSQKKVYLIAPEPVPEEAVERICLSILENNGYTLVKVGRGSAEVYKLVEVAQAASKPLAIYSAQELERLGDGDYFVCQLVLVQYLKAANIIASLRQAKLLDPQVSSLVEIPGANALLISDFAPNVKRLVEIVTLLDKPPPALELAVIPLKYAQAEETATKLRQLFQERAREMANYNWSGGSLVFLADTRTNTLTVRGLAEEIAQVRQLLTQWDAEVQGSQVEVRTYKLQRVPVEKILPTLRELATSPYFKAQATPSRNPSQNAAEISILANEYTRTLLITAPPAAHAALAQLIESLDRRRPQVLLESAICEFTPTDVLNLGIELTGLENMGRDGTQGHAVSSFGLSSLVDAAGKPVDPKNPTPVVGRSVVPGAGLTTFLTRDKVTNIPILLKTLQSTTHTEVLSMPRILVDDGEKAEIRVQQEEPVTSVTALNTSTTTTSFKEFVPAGTSLIITPQILHRDWLRLEIEQSIEAFNGTSPAPGVPPPKSSRSIKTTVTVPNGRTIILGGLCGRREVETIDQIPILGDIPLLGLLFQSRARTVSKTNLYIFITPQILEEPGFSDLDQVSQKARQESEAASPTRPK